MPTTAASEAFVTIEQVRASGCPCIDEADDGTPSDEELQEIIDEASDMIAIASGFVIAGRRALIARPEMCGDVWTCPCHGFDGIPLGDNNPVVTQVKIDGRVLSTSEYMTHATLIGPMLVRLDTSGAEVTPRSWPSSQRIWLPDTAEHTFAIYFTEGLTTDRYLIREAVLEVICDMVSNPWTAKRKDVIPGAVAATMGNVTVQLEEDRIERIRSGALGPATERMMGVFAPGARQRAEVWAPEMLLGWELNLRIP